VSGQVPPGRANLLFDQIEVIEEPLSGGRDPAFRLDRRRQLFGNGYEDGFVFSQAGEKLVGTSVRTQLMRGCQGFAMLLHLVGAEQLRPQRQQVAGVLFGQAVAARSKMEQGLKHGLSARLHF
jgi:hypothetical protein